MTSRLVRIISIVSLALAALATPAAATGAGDPDPAFGDSGTVVGDLGGFELPNDMTRQSDGKLVVTGVSFDDTTDATDLFVARFLADGRLDPSFGGGDGSVTADFGGDESPIRVAVDSLGRIVVVGGVTPGSGDSDRVLVARFLPTGTPDPAFGTGGGTTTNVTGGSDDATDVALEPSGGFTVVGEGSAGFLIRYQTDGSRDPGFGNNGIAISSNVADISPTALVRQNNGRYVVAGTDFDPRLGPAPVLVRVGTNGDPDTGFGAGRPTGVLGSPLALELSGSHFFVAGTALSTTGPCCGDMLVGRYLGNGDPDAAFGSDGFVVRNTGGEDFATHVIPLVSGGAIVSGTSLDSGLFTMSARSSSTFSPLDIARRARREAAEFRTAQDELPDLADAFVARVDPHGDADAVFGEGGLTVVDRGFFDFEAGLAPSSGKVLLATPDVSGDGGNIGLTRLLGGTHVPQGYCIVTADGGVQGYGECGFHGTAAITGASGRPLNAPIVGAAPTPTGKGYWLVASDGGIFAFGDAKFFGSLGGVHLNKPIVGMAATPTGVGYWLVASDGGIFTFGDAKFLGSEGAVALNKPIVGMGRTPSGGGYWLVASDGGIFTHGDAVFFGSTGAIALNKPIVGMAPYPTGEGYWLVASDGGVFTFGPKAAFHGSTGAVPLKQPIVGIAATASGAGYWLGAADAGVFAFGDAKFSGSGGALTLNQPAIGILHAS